MFVNRRHLFLLMPAAFTFGCANTRSVTTTFTQSIADVQAIVKGVQAALPSFTVFLPTNIVVQTSADLARAQSLVDGLAALTDSVSQATSIQGVLNLVSGIANVIASNLPSPPPNGVLRAIQTFQAVMAIAQAVAPIVAPYVGQKAGGTSVPVIFRSTITVDAARAKLGA